MGLPLEREGVDAGGIGQHQLGLTFLFHLAMNGGPPGGEQGEIAQAHTAGLVEKRLIALGMVPLMNIERQKCSNNLAKRIGTR